MRIQQLTPEPQFTRGKEGEVVLSRRIAIAIYAETASEEEWIQKLIMEKI